MIKPEPVIVCFTSGEIAIPYLMKGLQIEGIDAEDMLSVCRDKCKHLDLSPILYQQKMEEMIFPY